MPVVEKEAEASDTGWVYREQETAASVVEVAPEAVAEVSAPVTALMVVPWPEREIPAPPASPHRSAQMTPDMARMAVMAGMGALAFGVLTTGLASLAVVGLITGPVFAARRLMAAR